MSSGTRQEARREARQADKQRRQAEQEAVALENESLLAAVDRIPKGIESLASKISVFHPVVVRELFKCIDRSGTTGPLHSLLREHRGCPSKVAIRALQFAQLAANWERCSFLRQDMSLLLARMPKWLTDELGTEDDEGFPIQYRTFHKQQERFEDALPCADKQKSVELDMNWYEEAMVPASIPREFFYLIEALAIDETAFESWYDQTVWYKQADVDKKVRAEFRKRHGRRVVVPEMSSPKMLALAAEMGFLLGLDGRLIRSLADIDARSMHKTATNKRSKTQIMGYAPCAAVATRSHTLCKKTGEAIMGVPLPRYIMGLTTAPGNTDPGPTGMAVLSRVQKLCPNLKHVIVDQGFSAKKESFAIPVRKENLLLHMKYAKDKVTAAKIVRFAKRGGVYEDVIESCGEFFHRFMPKKYWNPSEDLFKKGNEAAKVRFFEERDKWRMVVISWNDDGSVRFGCPFCAGRIYNLRLESAANRRAGAEEVLIPKDATACCNGSFVAPADRLAKYQRPSYGTGAHDEIMPFRNSSEGVFGQVKNKGGMMSDSCQAQGSEAHALAALSAVVVQNIQITMNRKIDELLAARKAKRSRKAETAVRKAAQDPTDGSERSEPDSRDSDEEASGEDDESSADVEAPSRAPP